MNHEAQNALLRILEEPPPQTTLVLATATAAGLLATVRSRCQRVRFESDSRTAHRDPEREAMRERFDGIAATTIPDLLDWAAEYRGARAAVVGGVEEFLETASLWVRDCVVNRGARDRGRRHGRTSMRSGPSAIAARRCRNATQTPRWWWSARCSHYADPRFDE